MWIFFKPSSLNQLTFLLTNSARFSSQINNTQQKIITKNLTVKDNNNHITCTQVIFGQFITRKTSKGKPVSRFGFYYYWEGKYRDLLQ